MMSFIFSKKSHKYKLCSLFIFFLIFSFIPAAYTNAELYIWTDEEGIQHFSNTAPSIDLDEVVSKKEDASSGVYYKISSPEEEATFEKINGMIRTIHDNPKKIGESISSVKKIIYQNLKLVHAEDYAGYTLLHTAVSYDAPEIVQLLINNGADVNAANKAGTTPLHEAVYHPDILKELISKGANVNAADKKGRTPLHYIAMEKYSRDRRLKVAQILIQNSAKTDIKDKIGKTAKEYVSESNFKDLISLLSTK